MTAAQPRLSDYATLIRPTRSAERATSPLGRGGPKGRGGFLERTYEQTHPAAARHPSEEGIFGCLASSQVVIPEGTRPAALGTDRRQFIYPRLGLFKLRRNAEQHVFPPIRRHEMHANRQAVFAPV